MSSPARRLAIDVILRVEQGGAFLNLALDGALRAAGALEAREAALTTALSYGTVRWQQQLDRTIEAHSARPLAELRARACRRGRSSPQSRGPATRRPSARSRAVR